MVKFLVGRGREDSLINKLNTNPKRPRQRVQRETAVRLEELVVCEDAHLADVEACVGGEEARGEEEGLFEGCCMRDELVCERYGEVGRGKERERGRTYRGRRRTCRSASRRGF